MKLENLRLDRQSTVMAVVDCLGKVPVFRSRTLPRIVLTLFRAGRAL